MIYKIVCVDERRGYAHAGEERIIVFREADVLKPR
jgi:hypothetical protein